MLSLCQDDALSGCATSAIPDDLDSHSNAPPSDFPSITLLRAVHDIKKHVVACVNTQLLQMEPQQCGKERARLASDAVMMVGQSFCLMSLPQVRLRRNKQVQPAEPCWTTCLNSAKYMVARARQVSLERRLTNLPLVDTGTVLRASTASVKLATQILGLGHPQCRLPHNPVDGGNRLTVTRTSGTRAATRKTSPQPPGSIKKIRQGREAVGFTRWAG